MINSITKRDGRQVPFNIEKIAKAIYKAAESVGGGDYATAENLAEKVESAIMADIIGRSPSVEEVQDIVERVLIENGHAKTAKAYILYRAERTRVRESNASLMKTYEDLTFNSAIESDVKRENANINGDTAMGTMLKYGSEGAKKFNNLNVLDPRHAKAHIEGDIHVHDLDFYTLTTTCCQIDLKKLFDKGFSTGHGHLRTPNSIQSYAALACIAIQSNQNDQHGGQSIPEFDYYMSDGVKKTFKSAYVLNLAKQIIERADLDPHMLRDIKNIVKANMKMLEKEHNVEIRYTSPENHFYFQAEMSFLVHDLKDKLGLSDDQIENIRIYSPSYAKDPKSQLLAEKYAELETERATYQAMEALIHNLNTMNSRAGAQVPFSSINYGTDTSPEGRLVVKNLLLATQAGLGDGETPIFPVQIYKVKNGVNYDEGDPNYDLFKLAMETSAMRMFPNFSFIDAPFNIQYYDGTPDSEVAYMGCVEKSEVVTYTINDELYVEGIGRAWDRLARIFNVVNRTGATYIDLEPYNVKIYDSHNGKFVKVKKWIRNPNYNNWISLKLSNGRCLTATSDHPLPVRGRGRMHIKELELGYEIPVTFDQYVRDPSNAIRTRDGSRPLTVEMAWLAGLMLCNSSYITDIRIDLGEDNGDIEAYANHAITQFGIEKMVTTEITGHKVIKVMTLQSSHLLKDRRNKLAEFFDGWEIDGNCKIPSRHIPNHVFSWSSNLKAAFLAGMLDANCHIDSNTGITSVESSNKEVILQQMALLQSLCVPVKYYDNGNGMYRIEVDEIDDIVKYMQSGRKIRIYESTEHKKIISTSNSDYAKVVGINMIDLDDYSYDVETESDRFDVSGIMSHNCRTRVMGNVHDKSREITPSRGNLSFTTINLPRLAIEHGESVQNFYDALDDMMELVSDQLLHRFRIIANKTPRNFPFLMAQGVWLDSEKLGPDDKLEEILKHGTLSIGFIGLAETLVLLTGKHHGESESSQELGLQIISHMRKFCDDKSQKTKLNFTLLATPAEGLSGRFIAIDKKRYGVIPGVTDKDFYTNSFHVPVYYPISAFKKIQVEAPYHALTNAGHISYVEMDGDPTKNLEAFEQVIRCMHDSGIGYGAVNHPIDRDPICGYNGIIDDECPCCRRHEEEIIVEHMPRPDFVTKKHK